MRIVHYGDFMTRLIDRLNLLSQLGLIVIVALSCMYAAPVFAFHGAGEQPTSDEPVIEEDDDFVIPDDPDQDVDDVVAPEEDEEEQQPVAPTRPTPPVAPQGGSGDATQMEISLARALIVKAEAFATAGKWRDAAATYIEATNISQTIHRFFKDYNMYMQCWIKVNFLTHIKNN